MLLKADDLTISFGGTPVLDRLSFAIGKGQRVGLIGESGAGKTMLALALVGLLPANATMSGTLSFEDAPLPADEAALVMLRGKRIGIVLQQTAHALDPLRSVATHLTDALQRNGQPATAADVAALLADVGLDAKLAPRFPHQVSAGQRQQIMVALALAGKPDLLIADEPASALDVIAQRKIVDLIERHCSERDMALLLISHDLRAAALLCSRIMVLRGGKLVEAGDKLEVLGHPKQDYTKLLLAAGRHRARTLMRAPIGGDLLELRHVSRRYRQPDVSIFQPRPPLVALDDVSFTIRGGESLALVGPSGSGKSTLARIITGLERASAGELEFDHHLYHGPDMARDTRRDVALVFEDPTASFNPRLTVGESIAEPLRLEAGAEIEDLGRRIVESVNAVGLAPDMLARHPHEFSVGQRQRLAIARALVTRPRLIVLDEPVAALDVIARGEVLVLLNRLRADFGLTFLVISHDIDMVRVVADRIIVMDKGKIVETGTPAQLLEKPQQEVTRELIAAGLPDVGIVPVL